MVATLLLTRPEAQSRRFAAAALERFGAEVAPVIAPLMRLEPRGPLPRLPEDVALIFTSEAGVAAFAALGGTALGAGGARRLAWCVGPRTAEAAREAGFEARQGPGDAAGLAAAIAAWSAAGPAAKTAWPADGPAKNDLGSAADTAERGTRSADGRAESGTGAAAAPAAKGTGAAAGPAAKSDLSAAGPAAGAAPLVHLHGAHVSGDVAGRLRAAGLAAGTHPIYAQAAQPLPAAGVAALAGAMPVLAPVFSPRSAALLAPHLAAARAPVAVAAISPAAAAPLEGQAPAGLRVAARPDAAAMLETIGAMLADGRFLEADPGPR